MSRSFDGATTSLDNSGSAPLTAVPLTLFCWFKPAAISITQTLVALNTTGGGSNQFELVANSDNTVGAQTSTASTSAGVTAGTITNGVWNMCGAVFASATDRKAYLNGELGTAQTTTRTPTGINEIRVGKSRSGASAFNQFANGLVAYVVVYDIALSEPELDSLYNAGAGVDPTTVQGAHIVAIYDLTGNESPEIDDDGAIDLTVTAATFSSDNPFTISVGGTVPKFMQAHSRRRRS